MSEEVWTNETEIIRRDEAGNVRRFVRVGLLEQAQQDNAQLRSHLAAVLASYVTLDSAFCPSCGAFLSDGLTHKSGCVWVAAKQYLEAHNA